MSQRSRLSAALLCTAIALACASTGCQCRAAEASVSAPREPVQEAATTSSTEPEPTAAPPKTTEAVMVEPTLAPPPILQVAAANPLPYPASIGGVTTFRIPVKVMRAGSALRVAFSGGTGALSLREAHVGRYLGAGAARDQAQLSFEGEGSARADAGLVVSDELRFSVGSGELLAFSFAAAGSVPSGRDEFAEGVRAPGSSAGAGALTGLPEPSVRAIKWIAVLGPPQPVIAVLGDSIGAGCGAEGAGHRFISVAQELLAVPVVDASIDGDSVRAAADRLERDVLSLPGVTDCVVQVGTNNLNRWDERYIIEQLSDLYRRLAAAGIKPWGATLIPKLSLHGDGERRRQSVNAFIRSTPLVEGVVEFDGAMADPKDPSKPRRGTLRTDGIHPNSEGHRRMGEELARALRDRVEGGPDERLK